MGISYFTFTGTSWANDKNWDIICNVSVKEKCLASSFSSWYYQIVDFCIWWEFWSLDCFGPIGPYTGTLLFKNEIVDSSTLRENIAFVHFATFGFWMVIIETIDQSSKINIKFASAILLQHSSDCPCQSKKKHALKPKCNLILKINKKRSL